MESLIRTVTEVPDMTQVRTMFYPCRAIVNFIPQELVDDGLSYEVFQAVLDTYVKHRIEPEQLLFTNIDSEWNSFRTRVFTLHIDGVKLINEIELDDMGEMTTVYSIWESEEEDEKDTPFCQFMNKWFFQLKEKCHRDFNAFTFTVEFSRFEHDGESRYRDVTKHVIFLSEENEWYRTQFKVDRLLSLTDFTMPQRGF